MLAYIIIATLIIYQFDWPKEIFPEVKIFLLPLEDSMCKVRFPLSISTALGMNWIDHQLQYLCVRKGKNSSGGDYSVSVIVKAHTILSQLYSNVLYTFFCSLGIKKNPTSCCRKEFLLLYFAMVWGIMRILNKEAWADDLAHLEHFTLFLPDCFFSQYLLRSTMPWHGFR